jgi:hypothetical protein
MAGSVRISERSVGLRTSVCVCGRQSLASRWPRGWRWSVRNIEVDDHFFLSLSFSSSLSFPHNHRLPTGRCSICNSRVDHRPALLANPSAGSSSGSAIRLDVDGICPLSTLTMDAFSSTRRSLVDHVCRAGSGSPCARRGRMADRYADSTAPKPVLRPLPHYQRSVRTNQSTRGSL